MKVTAPLFSLDASGSIGGAIVASKWKGRNYMRRLVTPANPKSDPQMSNRGMFGFLAAAWAGIDPMLQAEWEPLAAQGNYSPFNAFVRSGQRRWTQFTYPFEAPSEEGDGAIANPPVLSATGGVGQISGTVTPDAGDTDRWAVALYLNTTPGGTFAQQDLKIVVEARTNAAFPFVISGIAPGTYALKGQSFTIGGESAAAGFQNGITVT